MNRLGILFGLLLLAPGCTGYHTQDWTGGYTETWLREDALIVRFYGNAYTSVERAEEMALLRAAELAVSKGYENIAIMHGASYINVWQWSTGGNYDRTHGIVSMPPGGSGYIDLTTEHVEPTTITYHRPRAIIGVRCFNVRPADIPEGTPILSAPFMCDSLGGKYGIKRLSAPPHRQ